jgi:replicative DNA helicase
MATSKYIDPVAVVQVIGCVYNNPSLLSATDKYNITAEDFADDFHRITFGSIYKLYELGAKRITLENIMDFLSSRPKYEAIFKQQKGEEWVLKAAENATESSFDYYYGRLKKFSLLRAYDTYGVDVRFIYDPDNILDIKKQQLQEEHLDNSTLDELAQQVDDMIENIRIQYVDDVYQEAVQASEGLDALIESFKERPEVGVPMYGALINTVTRGARLGKFYLRSAPTGVGKSRTMIADTCYIGCNEIYDDMFGWRKNGTTQPVLYITTEQDKGEIQTMMLAFLASVNEEHILNGRYIGDEEERVRHAIDILKNSPVYIVELPDFSLQDIEDIIKKNIREHDIKYVFHDYIHTSIKILEEITRRSGGVRLREDNILFMLSTRLKDICNQYGIFILSSTQLNADYQVSETPDQNLLRGAKAIADKIDWGSVLLPVKQEDLDSLAKVLQSSHFEKPTHKLSIYKNRRGRYNGIYLWCVGDLGTCRINPIFATNWSYELIQMEDFQIEVESESVF